MNGKKLVTATAVLLAGSASLLAQEEKKKTLAEIAADSADGLATILGLDDSQTYRVDSTFVHDYTEMTAEMEKLKRSGATNQELYIRVSDRWSNSIDSTFECLFTPEQWEKYLKKTDFGREKRSRDKRIAKRKEKGLE